MATAKSLRRQAATCAALAKSTYDEESRQRYLRLEQIYLQLAEDEEPLVDQAAPRPDESQAEAARQTR